MALVAPVHIYGLNRTRGTERIRMHPASRCSVCNEYGHSTKNCPELVNPPSPSGGGGGDHDDECCEKNLNPTIQQLDDCVCFNKDVEK